MCDQDDFDAMNYAWRDEAELSWVQQLVPLEQGSAWQ